MIEYLQKLIEERRHEQALQYAEQLLLQLSPENSSRDMMVVNWCLMVARFELGEFFGAQVAGDIALKMAETLEEWDYFGQISAMLGTTYARLRKDECAVSAWYDYIGHLHQYSWALQWESSVWFNLGTLQARNGRSLEAATLLEKALKTAERANLARRAHGIRHALTDVYIVTGSYEKVPPLLAQCSHYLRHNKHAKDYLHSQLWHWKLRADFAIQTGRLDRALLIAQRGIRHAVNHPHYQFQFHLLFAAVYDRRKDVQRTFAYLMRARVAAMRARRFDSEQLVTEWVYRLCSEHEGLMADIRIPPSWSDALLADDEYQTKEEDE